MEFLAQTSSDHKRGKGQELAVRIGGSQGQALVLKTQGSKQCKELASPLH